ncbi:MAG: lipoate--protein ligase [Clostridia bacterium]|nr:lipoate--protein ligase [Clostridia bacterium]
MIKKLLIYTSEDYNPYENLAKEKLLLDGVREDEMILYLWQNKNTVVIGKNQNAYVECPVELLKKDDISLARRLSGGGAVFHDLGNLNFTFISSSENQNTENNLKIIDLACKMAGIETLVSGRNDILAKGRKFSGNAFYNSKGKSYHHGTILIDANEEKLSRYLTPSEAKLKAKGVKSVRSRVINLKEINPDISCEAMRKNLIKAFEEFYGIKAERIKNLPLSEIKRLSEEYSSWEYLLGSQPPFDLEFSQRFEWGSIDIRLQVEKGVIKTASVYTDSMDFELSEKIESALKGCNFKKDAIEKALKIKEAGDIIGLFEQSL